MWWCGGGGGGSHGGANVDGYKALWDCMKLFSLIFHIFPVEVIIIIIII